MPGALESLADPRAPRASHGDPDRQSPAPVATVVTTMVDQVGDDDRGDDDPCHRALPNPPHDGHGIVSPLPFFPALPVPWQVVQGFWPGFSHSLFFAISQFSLVSAASRAGSAAQSIPLASVPGGRCRW